MHIDLFFTRQVKKYGAQKIKCGITKGNLPTAEEIPEKAIWFETQNFGWIISRSPRRVLLKY